MTSAALRWLPPVATALLHHGFVLAMLVDSVRLEALDAPAADASQGADPASDEAPSSTVDSPPTPAIATPQE